MSDRRLIIIKIGEFLYKYRAVIAAPFFIFLVIFSRPTHLQIFSIIFMIAGTLLRIWAAGYIGTKSRDNRFTTPHLITSGPYRYLRHPLYLGNFFLVIGVILLFNPPIWLAILLIILFIIVYSMIIFGELHYLKNLPEKKVRFKLINAKGEISTIFIMCIIYLVYLVRTI